MTPYCPRSITNCCSPTSATRPICAPCVSTTFIPVRTSSAQMPSPRLLQSSGKLDVQNTCLHGTQRCLRVASYSTLLPSGPLIFQCVRRPARVAHDLSYGRGFLTHDGTERRFLEPP